MILCTMVEAFCKTGGPKDRGFLLTTLIHTFAKSKNKDFLSAFHTKTRSPIASRLQVKDVFQVIASVQKFCLLQERRDKPAGFKDNQPRFTGRDNVVDWVPCHDARDQACGQALARHQEKDGRTKTPKHLHARSCNLRARQQRVDPTPANTDCVGSAGRRRLMAVRHRCPNTAK